MSSANGKEGKEPPKINGFQSLLVPSACDIRSSQEKHGEGSFNKHPGFTAVRERHQLDQSLRSTMVACHYDSETVPVHRGAPASLTGMPMLRDHQALVSRLPVLRLRELHQGMEQWKHRGAAKSLRLGSNEGTPRSQSCRRLSGAEGCPFLDERGRRRRSRNPRHAGHAPHNVLLSLCKGPLLPVDCQRQQFAAPAQIA